MFALPSPPGWGCEGNPEALRCEGGEVFLYWEGLLWSEMKLEGNNSASWELSSIYDLASAPCKICSYCFIEIHPFVRKLLFDNIGSCKLEINRYVHPLGFGTNICNFKKQHSSCMQVYHNPPARNMPC